MANSNRSTLPQFNVSFVRKLIAAQFPKWAALPLEPFNSTGTVNVIYRLGSDMVVRLPFDDEGSEQVKKEYHWLPILAPHLPLAIPTPLAIGTPSESYPLYWSVYRWIIGENAINERIDDPYQEALKLGHFVDVLHQIDSSGGPSPGEHNFFRGVPLMTRDAAVREAIANLHNTIDIEAATIAWDAALQAPLWKGHPV